MSTKKIVILGGSYGGLSVAHHLLRHTFPHLPEGSHQIVLVSASSDAFDRPAAPRALISDHFFQQDKLFVSIPKMLEQYPRENWEFIHGKATGLDHEGRRVTVTKWDASTENIEYYALVIATGASTPSPLHSLNTNEAGIRESWIEFRKALPDAKSIVICGGGPTGVETAGELGEYLNGKPGWFGKAKPKVAITLVTSASKLLPVTRDAVATKAERMLSDFGVIIMKNARVQSVSPEGAGTKDVASKATVTLEDGKTLKADLYIPSMGSNPNSSFIDKSLLTEDGRVDTNPTTLRVDKAGLRVYAVGDIASYGRPACHLTFNAVPIVAGNIKRDLLIGCGREDVAIKEDKVYKADERETHMVPIGTGKGVGAAMGYQLPSFMVWLIKGRDYWLWTTGPLWSGKQWAKEG